MILIKPSAEIISALDGDSVLKFIELSGRTCYKSETKITDKSSYKFIKTIINKGHHSVIEHVNVSVRIICDRGVSHEIVRHRLASYSQESTRYVNYKNSGCCFVIPSWVSIEPGEYNDYIDGKDFVDDLSDADYDWFVCMLEGENAYNNLIYNGWSPQQARSVLPNSTKTELVMTANIREWRHVFNLRCSKAAHPQMRELMLPLLKEFKNTIPIIFDDIYEKYEVDINEF